MFTRAAILARIIEPKQGRFSAEHAQYVLSLEFTPDEQARYAELSAKAQSVLLNPDEQVELDDFLAVNAILMILQSKARTSLRKHISAA